MALRAISNSGAAPANLSKLLGDLLNVLFKIELRFKVTSFGFKNHFFEVDTGKESTLILDGNCQYNSSQAKVDWEEGKAKLLLVGSIAPIANSPSDTRFEKLYGITYADFGCTPPIEECIKDYNEQIFVLMDEKYGNSWRNKVRNDVEYLKNYF